MTDEIAQFNKERWEALAQANVTFSRPFLNLSPDSARHVVDPHAVMGSVQGKNVLCLASGGGQQSAAFALLGAKVTVFDLSETQLERDRHAATHYNLTIQLEQGDMRDLSRFANASFDVVWHAYSINFVPDVRPVLAEVRRILKPHGLYRIEFHNPFVKGSDETLWRGEGYLIKRIYRDGEVTYDDSHWTIEQDDGTVSRIEGPREFNHTLGTMVNELVKHGFVILHLSEALGDPTAAPGTWEHYMAVAPPWMSVWSRLMPEVF